ncbi:MAG: hypothetical protein WKG01_14025 [Kofleriaceae bacterium]
MHEPRAMVELPVVAFAVVALVTLQLGTCRDSPHRDHPPAIAVAEDRYTVVWMRPARHGGALLVQQFARDTLKPLGAPHAVVEREDLQQGGVELVAIDGGYIATSRVDDPNKKPVWATEILAVRLDASGNAAGSVSTFSIMDEACHGAGVIEDRVVIPYIAIGRSHRYPKDELGILVVDRLGGYLGDRLVAFSPYACAGAARGREIAIAWTRRTDQGTLHVAFEQPFRGGRDERFAVPVGDVSLRTVRIAPHADGWAILHADPGEHLRVAFVNTHGTLLRTRELPHHIDASTVDFATNAHGLFVTWVDGGRVRLFRIDGESRALKAAGFRASKTRALGDAASCVTAWSTDRGKRVRIAKDTDCR